MKEIKITDIQGIKIGHAENIEAGTGCTVIICEKGAYAGVDVRGGAPASRETQLLNPVNLVEQVHAVVLSGGSAFGLDCAAGVMEYLERHDIGFDVQVTKVPIVCGAALFDLVVGDHKIRPDKKMGYDACVQASDKECLQGSVGAGTGASVGKLLGMDRAMRGGIGIYGVQIGDLKVASIVAVNCLGDVIHPDTGERAAGLLDEAKKKVISTEEEMYKTYSNKTNLFSGNTTIGVVITNGKMNKPQATKVASMTHNGFARSMRPAHSMFDGDTIYALSTSEVDADVNVIGALGAETMAKAVYQAVISADSRYGILAHRDL
ncbi:MAG: P1 family peptidase [Clostridia bacterium]|nr:P1 family peptidase [Clostridia bacterium]